MKYLDKTGAKKLVQNTKDLLNDKANKSHTHVVSDITDLPELNGYTKSETDTLLSAKQDSLSTNQLNAANSGITSSKVSDYDSHISDNDIHVTTSDKSNWDSKADGTHTHTVSDVTDFPTLATVATSGSYNDLSNKPTSMTPASHTHGSISNDGKIGTASGKPLITTTGGSITTGSFGTSAGTFCEGNDSRLSDSRNPTAHTHSASDITSGLSTVATSGSYNDLSNKPTIPTVDSALSSTSTNALQNKVINTELSKKANTSHTHTVSDVTDFPTLATVATSGSYNDLSNKPTSMTPASHTHGSISNDGKLGTTANLPLITTTGGTIATGSFGTTANTFCQGNDSRLSDARTPTAHNHSASEITSGTLDSARIPNLDASKITSGTIDIARLPAGALERLVTVADQTARYALTTSSVQLGDTVKQLDTGVMYYVVDISKLNSADGYSEYTAGTATSVPWSGVTGKPSSYTPASHTHGNITNAGAIGSTANKPLITTTNGVITTGSFGTTANTFCQGNDSRLSDSRTPTAHTHSASDITSGLATVATSGSYNDLSNKPTIPTVDSALSSTSTNPVQNKAIYTELSGKSDTGHTHTVSDVTDFPTLATVATSGSYNDLSNKPTIPTVNNATLTIQKNGTTVKTFTANASSNVTANITVPTKTSDLTNDSHQSITVGTDTTSTGTPAHGGTFTCVDSVTRDTNGHVTAINTKTVTLPADSNTDTKVTQAYSTTNNSYPVLSSATAGITSTSSRGATTAIVNNGIYTNPSTGALYATKLYSNGTEVLTSHQSLSNYVTLNGDETITGTKLISSTNPRLALSISGTTRGTNPSSKLWGNIYFQDQTTTANQNKRAGSLDCGIDDSGQTSMHLTVLNWGGSGTANIGIYYPKDGTPYTSAPTPATTDNSTKIATTAFVKAQIPTSIATRTAVTTGTWSISCKANSLVLITGTANSSSDHSIIVGSGGSVIVSAHGGSSIYNNNNNGQAVGAFILTTSSTLGITIGGSSTNFTSLNLTAYQL